jgi:hypothetical protein
MSRHVGVFHPLIYGAAPYSSNLICEFEPLIAKKPLNQSLLVIQHSTII